MGFFDGLMGGGEEDNSKVGILKELLSKENIEMKTELTIDKIKILTQIKLYYALQNMTEEEAAAETLNYYMALLTSNNRKGRTEIVEALKRMQEDENPQAALGNILKK